MLNVISSRIFPTSGEVIINGSNINDIQPQIDNVYLSGETNLLPESMKVREVFNWTEEFYPSFDKDLAVKLSSEFDIKINKKGKITVHRLQYSAKGHIRSMC